MIIHHDACDYLVWMPAGVEAGGGGGELLDADHDCCTVRLVSRQHYKGVLIQ